METKISDIESLPPICRSLPFIFNDTGARIENITVKCAGCGAEIDTSNIKGSFSLSGQSATLLAYAFCYADRQITPVEVRFGSGGELCTKGPDGWVLGRWGQEQPGGWLSKIKKLLRVGNKDE
jgi:hypothetical protein